MTDLYAETHAKLNAETGRLTWKELERHFARGVVIRVDPELDLIDVATRFVLDDKAHVSQWLESGEVARASEEEAKGWSAGESVFWAVVAAPWVLVQEIRVH
jgi:hypothetical protein